VIKLEISGVRYELDDKIKQYVRRKIGRLDKYLVRSAKGVIHGEVALIEDDGKPTNRFTCEVTLKLPQETLIAKESTINMFAAVDIAEAKLQAQVLKYKNKHGNSARFARTRQAFDRMRRFGRP
jgi:putative sigma-54 modulation protein